MESSYNATNGHFGIKLEYTEGTFWQILGALWAEGPICLDKLELVRRYEYLGVLTLAHYLRLIQKYFCHAYTICEKLVFLTVVIP